MSDPSDRASRRAYEDLLDHHGALMRDLGADEGSTAYPAKCVGKSLLKIEARFWHSQNRASKSTVVSDSRRDYHYQ